LKENHIAKSSISFALELSIILRGDNLDPEKLVELLGVEPDRQTRRGHTRTTASNKLLVEKSGLWSIRSGLVEIGNESRISELLNIPFFKLKPVLEQLRLRVSGQGFSLADIADVDEAYADYYIYRVTENGSDSSVEFELPLQQLNLFQELGLSVLFNIESGKP
jgi:Domain of unknown function (DUF4279)